MAIRRWPTYVLCGLCGLMGVGLVHAKYLADLKTAQQEYIIESDASAQEVIHEVSDRFRILYEGLRTIARLPGVRKIDRYATHFDADARQTVQEIYNNLAGRIALSEVYIVPLDLEPDRKDLHTGKPQEPITTFDHLIIGRTAGKTAEAKGEKSGPAPHVEEIEIYEYRLMKQQLAWLHTHFPQEANIVRLEYPVLSGPEVITCDNSYYSPQHPDDKDRSGIVYSVPFYGPDGKLKGCISGITLTRYIQEMLPSGNYVIQHPANAYTAAPRQAGQWQASRRWIADGQADPHLRYSRMLPMNIADSMGKWMLWAGQPDTLFSQRNDVQSACRFALLGYGAAVSLSLVLSLIVFLIQRQRLREQERNQKLEQIVEERTASLFESQQALRLQNESLESTVEERTHELVHQAFHDTLTGLPNRASVLYHLKQLTTSGKPGGKAVLFLDLDNFKFINDSLGHKAGDELLIAVTQRLQPCVRPQDMVARLGGDEFLIVLEALENVVSAIQVAERVLEIMKPGFALSGGEGFTAASIGIAYTTDADFDPDILIRDADTAMYHAKSSGKGVYALFEPGMNDRLTERVEMEVGLRTALEEKQFCVHYQPLVDLQTGQLTGVEALVRWQHPEKGLIPPGKFIPIAEETGLIVPLGYWVLEEACRQTLAWVQAYPHNSKFTTNVNLSGKQLQKPDVVERVREILERTGLPAANLKIEITESVMMEDVELAIVKLKQLHALGVKLALDDFGTGYSSMASLSSFPLDTVKIDRAFVSRLNTHSDADSVVAAIILLAKSLNMDVTGEGVETAEQVMSLQGMGCDIGQGYLFAKPLNVGALEEKMDAGENSFVQSYGEMDQAMIERLLAETDQALEEQHRKAA